MKNLNFILFFLITLNLNAQNISTNRKPNGLEHNMLFNATTRYTVTQTGNAKLNLNVLFDGKFYPSYTSTAPSTTSPTVILIEGIPSYHKQGGAWVGWSTRYWQPKRFKIEGYNSYNGANTWVTISDYTNQDYPGGSKHLNIVPFGSYTKFKFTIFSTYGENGRLGLSELFYIHPEAVRPYQGLLAEETWKKSGSSIHFSDGNVGIGTVDTKGYKLAVAGKTVAEEVVVKFRSNWPDYVFTEDYELPSLQEVEKHINKKGHLADIPSAKEVAKKGLQLGEMNKKLLQKIEELTLYTIAQEKQLKKEEERNKRQELRLEKLEKLVQNQLAIINQLKK